MECCSSDSGVFETQDRVYASIRRVHGLYMAGFFGVYGVCKALDGILGDAIQDSRSDDGAPPLQAAASMTHPLPLWFLAGSADSLDCFFAGAHLPKGLFWLCAEFKWRMFRTGMMTSEEYDRTEKQTPGKSC